MDHSTCLVGSTDEFLDNTECPYIRVSFTHFHCSTFMNVEPHSTSLRQMEACEAMLIDKYMNVSVDFLRSNSLILIIPVGF